MLILIVFVSELLFFGSKDKLKLIITKFILLEFYLFFKKTLFYLPDYRFL